MDTKELLKNRNETLFKPRHKLNIIIFSFLLLATMYLSYEKFWNQNMVYLWGGIVIYLLISEILKQSKKYILKINDELISYKEDKKVFRWNEIESFIGEYDLGGIHTKIIFTTKKGLDSIRLENYNKGKFNKVLEALVKHQQNFESKR